MIIIDRFEGNFAILETDNGMVQIWRSQLPAEAREGDVLSQMADCYVIDAAETQVRREKLLARTRKCKKL